MNETFNTPVAFFIFKRPEETRKVFDVIRSIRPAQLFIIADGPRNENEKSACIEARKIVENIDWPCNVVQNYSDTNLGCKKRVSSGIDWVFEHVDRAIILEDDCLPHPSFFLFCQELLEKYRDDERIMHISGINVQSGNPNFDIKESYYFSHVAQIWGWATWKRAWKKYDLAMNDWPEVREQKKIDAVLKNPPATDYFTYLFQKMYENKFDTWDVAWTYACMKDDNFSIVPGKNLVQNIGFGTDATHTKTIKGYTGDTKAVAMPLPLLHPSTITINENAEKYMLKTVFDIQSRIGQRILWFFKSNFPTIYSKLKSFRDA